MNFQDTIAAARAKIQRITTAETAAEKATRARAEAQAEIDAAEAAILAETAAGRAAAEHEKHVAELHRLEAACDRDKLAAAQAADIKEIVALEKKVRAAVDRVRARADAQWRAAWEAQAYARAHGLDTRSHGITDSYQQTLVQCAIGESYKATTGRHLVRNDGVGDWLIPQS